MTRLAVAIIGVLAVALATACGDDDDSQPEPTTAHFPDASEIDVAVLAGSGAMLPHGLAAEPGYRDGPATEALFDRPLDLAVAADGTLYIADSGNRRIRAITPDGQVVTIAGDGLDDVDDGPADQASFRSPVGLALDGDAALIVVDSVASNVRRIDLETGMVDTIAGSDMLHCLQSTKGEIQPDASCPARGEAQYRDGPGIQAWFSQPASVAVGEDGTIYIADSGNARIRVLDEDGVVSTFAGNGLQGNGDGQGESASFRGPTDIAIGPDGNLLVTDGTLVRRVTPGGDVNTIAGTRNDTFGGHRDGPADSALFEQLGGAWAGSKQDCVADGQFVRAIADGQVYTLAGTGEQGFRTGAGDQAMMSLAAGLVSLPDGRLAVADHNLNRILVLSWDGGELCG